MTESARPDSGALPIACTLGDDDGARRVERWRALHARATPTVRRVDGALRVRYPSEAGVHEELCALATAERRCCSFARWRVTEEDDHVVLSIAADGAGLDAVATLFAAP